MPSHPTNPGGQLEAKKQLLIAFGESDSEGGGIVVLEISEGSAAEADGSVRPALAPSAGSRLSDVRSRRSRGPACGRPPSGLATISERPRAPGRLWVTAEERRSRCKECLRAWRGGRIVGAGGGAGGTPYAVRAE